MFQPNRLMRNESNLTLQHRDYYVWTRTGGARQNNHCSYILRHAIGLDGGTPTVIHDRSLLPSNDHRFSVDRIPYIAEACRCCAPASAPSLR
jgi:hypothetical protein